ncbi:ATP-grasp domain-containing protein [Bacillus weihaiensis]|uniref:ATP-grasp domain-containing protein n=1 Tax=Bacillus weihaiensis TaxID=1547283 RepID=A0A1L3MRY8_9BACI|nr:ATP-grasp domain-containing protein [Bacillus weihaiensis]APH05122.1 hypothetical protein A9C19_10365 [Bacillus weihaiensis]
MKTIIFIGCNKSGSSREGVTSAMEMGYYTVLFTDRKYFLRESEELSDIHLMIYMKDLFKKEEVLKEIKKLTCKGNKIEAIISFIDPFVSYAATLSNEIGIMSCSMSALSIIENKIKFRTVLKHLSSALFYSVYTGEESVEVFANQFVDHFPLVVKPPISNGSKDVIFVNSMGELKRWIKNRQNEENSLPVLVEEYIEGRQFLVETIIYERKISIIAVIEQEFMNKNHFIITGYRFPAQLSNKLTEQLAIILSEIINKIGLVNGSCHFELRLSHGEWKLIEINPRISGGAMNKMIHYATGINLVKEILKVSLGERPTLEKTKNHFIYTHYLTVERRGQLLKIVGKDKASQHSGVREVLLKPRKGSILTPPKSMGDRYGYVIASGHSSEEAKKNAIQASKEIRFYLEPF